MRGERWGEGPPVGVSGWVGSVRNFPRFSKKILEISADFPRNFRDDRELQHGLVFEYSGKIKF